MFASRLPARIDPSSLARLITEARASGTEILDLTGSNPTQAGIAYPEQEILDGFQDRRALIYDPDPRGLTEAREQIARLENVSPDRVMLTASTSEAYSWLFKLLCDPGDEILVPQPSYPLFEHLAALEGVVVRHYPLRYFQGWFVDTHALAARITERTRAVVVVNPNNPTGSYLKKHEGNEIAGVCAERDLALISDDVFFDYALVDDPDRAARLTQIPHRPLAFSLNGLSKLVGLPQMKLGWIIVTGEDWQRAQALERLEIIADTFLSVGAPVQYALPSLLGIRERIQGQILERIRANFGWLKEAFQGGPISALRVEGGWFGILRVPTTRSEEEWVTALLRRERVLLQPGYFYDFLSPGYLVVSLLPPEAEFRQGIERVVAHFDASGHSG